MGVQRMRGMTIEEAARVLGVSRQRIDVLRKRGTLPMIPGSSPFIEVQAEAVERRLAEQANGFRSEPLPPGLLTVAEVAQRFGRSTSTVYGWIKRGALPSQRYNGRTVVTVEHVRSFKLPRPGRPLGDEGHPLRGTTFTAEWRRRRGLD